jgi:hypothetical protein
VKRRLANERRVISRESAVKATPARKTTGALFCRGMG